METKRFLLRKTVYINVEFIDEPQITRRLCEGGQMNKLEKLLETVFNAVFPYLKYEAQ